MYYKDPSSSSIKVHPSSNPGIPGSCGPNLEEVEGAYCFWDVRACVRLCVRSCVRLLRLLMHSITTDRSKAVVPVLVLLFVALWFILRGDLCHFVSVFFSPFSIAITSLANLSAFRTFVRFVLVWFCRFPLPLGVWEGLRFVIVARPGIFSYLYF